MNYLRISALALTTLAVISCTDKPEKEPLKIGNLELSEAKPVPGDSLSLWYTPENTADTLAPEAFFVYTVNTNSYPEDIDLVEDGERYKGSIAIPDSAQGLIFNFKVDDEYEANEEQGYSLNLYTESGEPIPGSEAGIAFYKLARGSYYGMKTTPDSTLAAINRALDKNPELKDDWFDIHMRVMNQVDAKAAGTRIDEELAAYAQKGELSKDDYQKLMTLYQIKRDQPKIDSIQAIFVDKYPKSQLAQNSYVSKMRGAQTPEEKHVVLEEFKEKIGTDGTQKDFLYRSLAEAYLNVGDTENFKKYMAMAGDDASKASTLNNIAWGYAESGENLELAEELSKKSLDIIEAEKSNKPDYYTARQYENNLKSTKAMYADTYGLILFKQGKVKEAIAAQEQAVADRTSPDVYERYMQYLTADAQYDNVFEKASELVEEGNATAKTKEYLATAYAETDQDGDFESYLSGLEKIAHDKALAELKKEMLDEEAPTFNLKNLNGEEIALADLKGKTVVLDFWATWCG
ncbi:TlpA disulfide reductase family protein, partial [Leeuwenhoekiella sp. UBA1003]